MPRPQVEADARAPKGPAMRLLGKGRSLVRLVRYVHGTYMLCPAIATPWSKSSVAAHGISAGGLAANPFAHSMTFRCSAA